MTSRRRTSRSSFRQRLRVAHVLARLLLLRAPLDLDRDRRARERAQHLAKRRHAEVLAGEATRRPALARRHAPQAIRGALEPVAVGIGAAGREPVRRVERAQLPEAVRRDRPTAVGRPVHGRVVHHDDLAAARDTDVELEHVGPPREPPA